MFHLTVDSKNPDFQFIHLDVLRNYGIICKFNNFRRNGNQELFDIIDCHIIVPSRNRNKPPMTFPFSGLSASVEVNATEYKYQMIADLSKKANNKMTAPIKNNLFTQKNRLGKPNAENIIDVEIQGLKSFLDIATDLGNGFCRFYIV